jgi:hypothetical protein
MVNICDIHIGQTLWFWDTEYAYVEHGRVVSIRGDMGGYVGLEAYNIAPYTRACRYLYYTQEEAEEDKQESDREVADKCKKKISNAEGLIRFMYDKLADVDIFVHQGVFLAIEEKCEEYGIDLDG